MRSARCLILLALIVVSQSVFAASPNGSWKGSWLSNTTGHQGPLRARVKQVDHDTYRAVFVGRFAKVVPFIYPAKLDRVPGTCNCYQSSQRIPLLGTYTMTASVSEHGFHAQYQGRKDHGVFNLSR